MDMEIRPGREGKVVGDGGSELVLQLGVACGQLASVMVQGWLTVGAEGRRVRGE